MSRFMSTNPTLTYQGFPSQGLIKLGGVGWLISHKTQGVSVEKPVISLGSHGPAGPFLTWSQLSVAGLRIPQVDIYHGSQWRIHGTGMNLPTWHEWLLFFLMVFMQADIPGNHGSYGLWVMISFLPCELTWKQQCEPIPATLEQRLQGKPLGFQGWLAMKPKYWRFLFKGGDFQVPR